MKPANTEETEPILTTIPVMHKIGGLMIGPEPELLIAVIKKMTALTS